MSFEYKKHRHGKLNNNRRHPHEVELLSIFDGLFVANNDDEKRDIERKSWQYLGQEKSKSKNYAGHHHSLVSGYTKNVIEFCFWHEFVRNKHGAEPQKDGKKNNHATYEVVSIRRSKTWLTIYLAAVTNNLQGQEDKPYREKSYSQTDDLLWSHAALKFNAYRRHCGITWLMENR